MPDPNLTLPLLLFLSHAGVDTEAARQLKQRLEAAPEAREHGLRVWFDRDDLRAGEPWQAQLEKAIRHSSTAFAVYVGSRGVVNWVDAEIQLALGRAVTDPAYRFIPILAPQAPGPEALPGFVALYQGVADVEGRPDQFAKLVAAILGRDAAGTATLEAEPFFGLKAVDEDRAHLFFGREPEAETLLQLLRREPLVMVTGDSGSGKSSLARAGLVPRWRGGALAEAVGERPSDTIWHVVQTQPRTRPFQTLAEAVSEAAKRLGLSLDKRGTLENWVRSGDPAQVRRALWCDLPPDRTHVLLLVDQFEELVTITEPTEREPFIQLLLALADPNDPRARIVLTMRRDYYNLLSTFPELYRRLEADDHRARLILGRISLDGLHRVVTEPLRLAGVPEGDREALADQIAGKRPKDNKAPANDIRGDMGDRPGDLALVQMALTETWDRRRSFDDDLLRAYAGVGRIEGAIARAAEDVYTRLVDAERALAEPVFIRLVRLGDTGGATRRLAARAEFDDAKWRLVQKLASKEAKRLVLVGGSEAGETAEIAHEALVTQWPRYQRWLSGLDDDGADRAADKRTLDVLTPRASGWAAAPDARAKAKRLATGADLDAFVGLAGRRPAWLSADELKFVSESRGANLRQQRTERWLFRGVVTAAVLAVVGLSVAVWYAKESEARLEQAIDITKGFVKKAVELSLDSGVPRRPAIEELLTQADTGYKQLMQEDTRSPQLGSARAELLMLFADHYRIIGEEAEQWGDAAKQAHDLLKELVADYPSNHELSKQLADSHDLIGDIHAHRTELDAALNEYRSSQSIREKLLTGDPSNPSLERDLSISQQLVGDMLLRQGHLDAALAAFEKALDISEPLARADPANLDWQQDVLQINHRIGDVLAKKGDQNGASEAYRASLVIAKRLAANDPKNIQLQYDLLASHKRIGDVLENQGDIKAALDAYRTSLLIAKQLAHDDPEKVDIQRHVSLGYDNVGRILLKQGDLQAALEAFRASLVIAEKLAVADPENASLQRDRSMRLNKIGDALKEQGDLQAALDHYRRSLAIRKQLAAVNPSSAELQRDVSMSYDRMGDVLEKLSQVQEAIAEYQASRVIAERLAAAEPTNAEWQRDLYTSYRNLGRVQEREGNREEARDMYCLAKKVVMTNSALHPANSQWQERLDWLQKRLDVLQGSGASPC